MSAFLYKAFIKFVHFGYQSVRWTYEKYKKARARSSADELNPYTYIKLFPLDFKADLIENNYTPTKSFPKYTTITPVLNEEHNIIEVLKLIESQTYPPEQVIIIDAESKDNTISKINEYIKNSALNIEIITSTVRNIGYQRNLGIKHARNNLIVNVDAGTYLDQHYMTNMIGPFANDSNVDMSIGVHYPKTIYPWSVHFSSKERFTSRMEPCGACIAYKRDLAIKAGGYPEYITYAGEDTLFCYRYKKLSKHWIFNKKAFIFWEHPTTFKNAQLKVMSYMRANFEIGLWPYFYNGSRFQLPKWIGYFFKIFREKFPTFATCQADVEINKRHIKGLRFILSKKRITDDIMLQDIVQKLIEDNYKVFFIDFSTSPPQNITPIFINTDHSLLELVHHTNFEFEDLQKRYGDFIKNSVFMIEHQDKTIINYIEELQKNFDTIRVENI